MNIDDRPTDDQRPTSGPIHTLRKISNGHISATRQLIDFVFGSRVGFRLRGRRIERRHFRLDKIKDGGWRLETILKN